jgi:hypothetical protein
MFSIYLCLTTLYTVSNGRMRDEWWISEHEESSGREIIEVTINFLLPGGTEENHEERHNSRYPGSDTNRHPPEYGSRASLLRHAVWSLLVVNAVWGNSRCLLWEPYGSHRYTVWAECRVCTSQETHYVSTTKVNLLMPFIMSIIKLSYGLQDRGI